MIILLILSALIALTYIILMTALIAGVVKLKKLKKPAVLSESDDISIVIPFRNEAHHLPFLLNSLLKQKTSAGKTELIFVNDHSEDSGPDMIKNFILTNPDISAHLISLSDQGLNGKKAAQKAGVEAASFDIIAFSDADCILPPGWVRSMSAYLSNGVMMACAPVVYSKKSGLSAFLYQTEFFSLMMAGAGAFGIRKPVYCNGAGMMIRKQVYSAIYDSVRGKGLPSGDDVFLLHAVISHYGQNSVCFAFDDQCTVETFPPQTFQEFFLQRMRWGSKSVAYRNYLSVTLALSVFFTNLCIFLLLLAGIKHPVLLYTGIIILTAKSLFDSLLFLAGTPLHKQILLPFISIFLQVLYIPYVLTAAVLSLLFPVNWKGRKAHKGI